MTHLRIHVTLTEVRAALDAWWTTDLEGVELRADIEAAARRMPHQMQRDFLAVLRQDRVGPARRERLEQALTKELNRCALP